MLLGLLLRSFVLAPFAIPSESMMPQLLPGDYVLVAKWPYGFSRHSLPGRLAWPERRVAASSPRRGDIVVFRAPGTAGADYVKRVIGLPGDTVAMRRGRILLDGRPVPRTRIADMPLPCASGVGASCRYTRHRETLPGQRAYVVLDAAESATRASLPPLRVPDGRLFVLGDHRSRSADSRLAPGKGGVGLVPEDALIGRPLIVIFSVEGSARWSDPAGWLRAVRWNRIGTAV